MSQALITPPRKIASSITSLKPRSIRSWISQYYGRSLFLFFFVIPMVIAGLFYGVIASDQYVSEVKFIVRGAQKNNTGGFSALLSTVGLSRANDDSYAISSYIVSRDALKALNETLDMRAIYSRPEADFLTSYDSIFYDETFESLYKYYQKKIILIEDVKTGITTLNSLAYGAEDAQIVAKSLLKLAEDQINRMNARAHSDQLSAASEILVEAEKNIVKVQTTLTKYRNQELLLDPEESAKGNFIIIASLSEKLNEDEVRLIEMKKNSPSNPKIASLENSVNALKQEIVTQREQLVGSDEAISSKLSAYEGLVLQRALADAAYESAQKSLDLIRQEANSQQIYLEAVVTPNLPDKAGEPKRIRYLFTVAVLSFACYIMMYLLFSGSREHLNLH